jgi:hypothetical protein
MRLVICRLSLSIQPKRRMESEMRLRQANKVLLRHHNHECEYRENTVVRAEVRNCKTQRMKDILACSTPWMPPPTRGGRRGDEEVSQTHHR